MKLQVHPVTSTDLEKAATIYGPEKGDLTSPLMGMVMPATESNMRERTAWSIQQQKDCLESDPTVRFVKVVDADEDDEIVSLGRWHKYPQGFVEEGTLEYAGRKGKEDPSIYPEGFNVGLYCGILKDLMRDRREWMGDGPYWVLTTIKTREPLQKNGAGSLILEWGLAQAAKDGVPAYLEAAAGAVGLYKKYGFREVGKVDFDASPYGMEGVVITLLRMRADPK